MGLSLAILIFIFLQKSSSLLQTDYVMRRAQLQTSDISNLSFLNLHKVELKIKLTKVCKFSLN